MHDVCSISPLQVQLRINTAKQGKEAATDEKDETVRGCLPLFKLRFKDDREKWRKLVMHENYLEHSILCGR